MNQKMANNTIMIRLLIFLLLGLARSQTTQFYYDFYGNKPTDLIYQGDAHFPSDSTYLRLTKTNASGMPVTNSHGRVLYSVPVQFWQPGAQVDLETTIKFIIKPVDEGPADGIVFFIAPVGTIPTDSGGGKFGVFDSWYDKSPSVFAVEFDTYVNKEVDPTYRHIGIDIEYLTSKNTTRVDDAILRQEVTARIDYEEATRVIYVKVTVGSKIFEVSYVYDLSTVLNQQVQVGLAASTGQNIAVHDIISWYFVATLVHNRAEDDAKIRQIV